MHVRFVAAVLPALVAVREAEYLRNAEADPTTPPWGFAGLACEASELADEAMYARGYAWKDDEWVREAPL